MKTNRISNTSFKAAVRVHGNTQELIDVGLKITEQVSKKPNGQPRFLWFLEPNNDKHKTTGHTFLIATEKDADIIDKRFSEGITRPKSFNSGNIIEFNGDELIKTPDEVVEAKDVLEAIKNKSFNFLSLLIKKNT